jgi:hypothetical protein
MSRTKFNESLNMEAKFPVLDEEDEACDFLHIGSGWRNSASALKPTACDESFIFGKVLKDNNEMKTQLRTGQPGQGRGCNRVTPYAREIKRLQSEIRDKLAHTQEAIRSDNRSTEPVKIKQADFESLSLGPGCPWLESVDLHI